MTASPRRRPGFTLIEALIFVPMGLMVLALVWTFFTSSARKGAATDVKLQGLQANLVLVMTLERDLESLYESRQYQMLIAEDGSALRFFRVTDDSPGAEWADLPVEEVEYRFDAEAHKVFRKVAGGSERPLFGYFEMVHFRVEAPPEPVEPSADLPPAASVVVTSVAIPETELEKPYEERDLRKRTTVVTGVSRRWVSSRVTYPYWNPIPYLPADRGESD